jgi:hypothetical protein
MESALAIVNFEEHAMSVDSVVNQIALIQEVQKKVMREGEHFGKIPGCGDKPSLLKPGAEKLGFTFRLRPEFDVVPVDWPNGHREYQVKCRLYHIPTGVPVGDGVGTCTTMEGKYRYRWDNTGREVPQEYWKNRDKDLLGGPFNTTRKVDGKWFIFQRVEHDNPADYYNTCEKMGKKRAHVDAILTATAASDIFTQDVEDMPEVIPGAKKEAATSGEAKPPVQTPQKKAPEPPSGDILAVTVNVKEVGSKAGEKNGKPYTIYTITDVNDTKYATFDANLADLARSAKKGMLPVTISYTVGKYGNKITDLTIEERDPGQDG